MSTTVLPLRDARSFAFVFYLPGVNILVCLLWLICFFKVLFLLLEKADMSCREFLLAFDPTRMSSFDRRTEGTGVGSVGNKGMLLSVSMVVVLVEGINGGVSRRRLECPFEAGQNRAERVRSANARLEEEREEGEVLLLVISEICILSSSSSSLNG